MTKSSSSRMNNLSVWLDERTGIKKALRGVLNQPIRGGARWAYVFGSALLALLAIQVLTGIFLALYYVPSADHAHVTVAYIQKVVPGGSLIRGLHYYGASAVVILVVCHFAQTFLFGAYKAKRELLWMFGGVLLLLILSFAFSGQLLPWDQQAYFSTRVGTSIAGEIPVFGYLQKRIMLGGADVTSITLTRFFMIHVFILPLALGFLVFLHVFLFRRAGWAGSFHHPQDGRVEPFYPKQSFMTAVFVLLVFASLLVLARLVPATLGPEATPGADVLARPPWYFLPLFEMLKYFPGKLALIPALVLPGLLSGGLFLLPFFDRRPERHPLKRRLATATLLVLLLGAGSLIWLAKHQDRANPEINAKLVRQENLARAFLKTDFHPQQIGPARVPNTVGATKVSSVSADPPQAFTKGCAVCHGDHGEGSDQGPVLVGITSKPNRSREDLLRLLNDPGPFKLKDPMPTSFPDLSADDKWKIVDWLGKLASQDTAQRR